MSLFSRFIEVGRLCVVQYGEEAGKLCFIVDIIHAHRVLIDGGKATGVSRQAIPIRRLALTDFKLQIPRGARPSTLEKAVENSDVLEKFAGSSWGKRLISKQRKANMTDFDRFKLAAIKARKAVIKRQLLRKLKKGHKNLPQSN